MPVALHSLARPDQLSGRRRNKMAEVFVAKVADFPDGERRIVQPP
jgi:hypothetical protein